MFGPMRGMQQDRMMSGYPFMSLNDPFGDHFGMSSRHPPSGFHGPPHHHHQQMHLQMQRMQHEMMSGFPFGQMSGRDPFGGDPFGMPSHHHQPHYSRHQQHGGRRIRRSESRECIVEEIEDDGNVHTGGVHGVVEEPDDYYYHNRQNQYGKHHESGGYRQQQHYNSGYRGRHESMREQGRFGDPFGNMFSGFGALSKLAGFGSGFASGGNAKYLSYSSSSFNSSGGPGGPTSFEETKCTRKGPGGVMESTHTMRDGRSGEERMELTRGIGHRQRTLQRARVNGRDVMNEEQTQGMHNPDEVSRFEQEWQSRASQDLLPGGGYSGGGYGDTRGQYMHGQRPGLPAPGMTSDPNFMGPPMHGRSSGQGMMHGQDYGARYGDGMGPGMMHGQRPGHHVNFADDNDYNTYFERPHGRGRRSVSPNRF